MSTEASTGGGGGSTAGSMSTGGSTGSFQSTGGSTGSFQSTGGSTFTGAWGDDWRQRLAAGSTDPERELQQLGRYESPEQIWRKARELERKLSSGEYRSTLKKDATPEELKAWRTENGIPAEPSGYKINMPQGKEPPKEDNAFLQGFLKQAHAQNYTQGQVDAAIASFYAEVDRQSEEVKAAEEQLVTQAEDKLRVEWGADYRMNKNMAEALLSRAPAGFRDRFMNGYLADGTPIRASVESWKWLVQMEREINPAATVVPGASSNPGQTIDAELTELRKLMANPNSEYWKGEKAEANQARYRQLLDAQEKLKAKGGG